MNETTNAHFKKFKKNVEKWIKHFGLLNWEVGCHHQDEDEDSENDLAYTTFVIDNRRADIFLTNEWCTDITDRELDKTAFHEVCEVLLLSLRGIATRRMNVSAENIEGAIHDIIRTLESVIFERKY